MKRRGKETFHCFFQSKTKKASIKQADTKETKENVSVHHAQTTCGISCHKTSPVLKDFRRGWMVSQKFHGLFVHMESLASVTMTFWVSVHWLLHKIVIFFLASCFHCSQKIIRQLEYKSLINAKKNQSELSTGCVQHYIFFKKLMDALGQQPTHIIYQSIRLH